MKRIYFGLCLFILLGNQCLHAGLNDGLVAYYPFNGNANDATGNGHNGTIVNAVLASDRFGNQNGCYSFNGVNSYITVTNSSDISPIGDFSVSVWLQQNSSSLTEVIISKSLAGVNSSGWFIALESPNWLQFQAAPNFEVNSPAIIRPPLNEWHHATFTFTRSTGLCCSYLDGVLVDNRTKNYSSSVSPRNITIGAQEYVNPGQYSYFFSGQLDDIRIYNRALSASEIQKLYSMATIGTAPTPPTVVQTNRTPSSTELGTQTSGSFKVFQNGNFVSGVALDPSKLTIVLTHGWNSSSADWPSNMASQFVAAGISANLVAWDWRDDATSDFTVSGCEKILLKTPNQGLAFGTKLLQNLGAGYSQPIHFIGHSFGTLVNAAAANYLEANNFSSAKMQVTLLDEAEIANVLGKPEIVSPTNANLGWIKPLPNSFAQADNYVSAVGILHDNTVNVILTENSPGAFYSSLTDLWNALKVYHGEPCEWYGETIANPAGSVMGNIWSFERNSSFGTPVTGTCFEQFGSGLGLEQISRAGADQLRVVQNGALAEEIGVYYVLKEMHVGVNTVGDVTANVIETALTDSTPVYETTPATIGISTYAPATPDFWSPQLILQNHPLNLGPNWKPLNVRPLGGPSSTPSNSPAYAWLPMTIPTNATSLSFDFMLHGDGAGDSFDAAVNGTNVFSLATSLIQTNVTMNSGLIDVSSYAGQNVELFLGIVGGASTNTILTVSGIRLYSIMPPLLQAQTAGNNFVLSWPLSASDYILQTSTSLTDTNSWTAVTNVPAIVNLQNTVTNPASDGSRFYRLRK